jgi:hypothetical protein
MVCKLCKKKTDLKESHIISEAFYEGIYDEKHRVLPISMRNYELKFIQKGIREKLLCGECEQKLSKWESILKRDLVDIGNKQSKFLKISHINEKVLKVEGIRYKEFKLAILSILWRMSITSDPFFASYNLGVYEEKLRTLLILAEISNETKYPIRVSRYEIDGVFYPDVFMGFSPGKYEQFFTVQSFIIWGHRFMIFVNDKCCPKVPIEIFLRSSGELYIDVRSLVELASHKSVLSKIYDDQVNLMYERMT